MEKEKQNIWEKHNIELAGFRAIDKSSMDIVRKIFNMHLRKIAEHAKKLETIKLTLKLIHEREKSEIYELHALVIDNGKRYVAETSNRNLFVAIDNALNKVLKEISRKL